MARLYRLTVNGHIAAEDAARLVFLLREIRNAVEAERDRAERMGVVDPATPGNSITIQAIPVGAHISPTGQLVDHETAATLWQEYRALRQRAAALPSRPALKVIIDADDKTVDVEPDPAA